jgi:hypothetical protein
MTTPDDDVVAGASVTARKSDNQIPQAMRLSPKKVVGASRLLGDDFSSFFGFVCRLWMVLHKCRQPSDSVERTTTFSTVVCSLTPVKVDLTTRATQSINVRGYGMYRCWYSVYTRYIHRYVDLLKKDHMYVPCHLQQEIMVPREIFSSL